jgi:glucokinase
MRLALGLDVGGTHLRAGVVDESGRIVAQEKRALADRAPEAVADAAAETAGLALAGAGGAGVVGAGVGVAAQVLRGEGVVACAPNLGWRDVPFGALMRARLPGLPLLVVNDLSAAAEGEWKVGAGSGARDVVVVFVGSGVGGGFVLGARLHEGARGVAAEVGHMKVRPGGRTCGCGEEGCLEAYAGGHALGQRAREELGRDWNAAKLASAARDGDAGARRLLEDAGDLLGAALANLCTVLNPARLILGGSVLLGSELLYERAAAGVERWTAAVAREGLTVVRAALGDDAGIVGAALLAMGTVISV